MDCPKCRHKNPKVAKFCNTCGNDLTRSGKSTRHVVA
ncbi:double zinc ribbon domain-containing protein, partial [Robiginitalea sp.]